MMKNAVFTLLVAVSAAIVLPSLCHADDYASARKEAYLDAVAISTIKGTVSPCGVIGHQVANIMVRRLNGEAMSTQMSKPDLAFFRFVIHDAYSQPFYQTPKMQEQLVRTFREKYELECFTILGPQG